jgi:hypothetical protein
MRKENISRLLLSIMTVFVMVVGVFAAAINTISVERDESEGSFLENQVAEEELELRTSEIGEAPISAFETNGEQENTIIKADEPRIASPTGDIGTVPVMPEDFVQPERLVTEQTTQEYSVPSFVEESGAAERGTRYPPGAGVDANGPYTGLSEGLSTTFDASIYGDSQDNYWFRWDVNGDGKWDGPQPMGDVMGYPDWGLDKGEAEYPHTFCDNFDGLAVVEAWDGSLKPVSGGGDVWGGQSYNWYLYWQYSWSTGMRFTVNEDCTVTELGAYRGYYPYGIYQLSLWTTGGTPLATVWYPYIPQYSWAWFPIMPVDLWAGNQYIVGMDFYGYYAMGRDNPGPTADGVIDPDGWMYGYSGTPPLMYSGSSPLPLCDIQYEYTYYVEDTLSDTAEVEVENVAPTVLGCAPSSPSGTEGTGMAFTAWMSDPGLCDEWWYKWIWGDGKETDWVKIPKYIFPGGVVPSNILYYFDGPTDGNLAGLAMDYLGLPHVDVSTESQMIDRLEDGTPWDLVVVQNPYYAIYQAGYDALLDYVEAGGKLIINTWRTEWHITHDLWSYLGATWLETLFTNPRIYDWDPTGDIFNWPLEVPTLASTRDYTYRDAYRLEPIGGVAHAVGGGTATPSWGQAHVVVRDDDQTIWNGFTPMNYLGDNDADGLNDAMELLINQLLYILGPVTLFEPYPLALELPPMYHIYTDDHPMTGTPYDEFDVVCMVKDDDHVDPYVGNEFLMQDHEDGLAGWSSGEGWQLGPMYAAGTGTTAQAWYYYYSPYTGTQEDSYTSPLLNCELSSDLVLEFDHCWWSDYPYSPHQDGYVEISNDGGSTWYLLDEFHMYDPSWEVAHKTYDISAIADYQPNVLIRFRMSQYDNWLWEVDNIHITGTVTIPGVPGMGSDSCQVTIFNVFPTGNAAQGFIDVVDEKVTVNFGTVVGKDADLFMITDPALKEKTETFWWRWNWDDPLNPGVTDWQETWKLIPGKVGGNVFITGVPMDFPCAYGYSVNGAQQLMYNMMHFCRDTDEGTVLYLDVSWFGSAAIMSQMQNNLNANFGMSYTWTYTTGTTALVDGAGNPAFDIVYFGYDWAYEYVYMGGTFPYTKDEILEYVDAGGHMIIPGDEFGAGELSDDWLPWQCEFPSAMGADFYMQFPGPACPDDPAPDIAAGVFIGDWGFNYELHNDIKSYDEDEFIRIFACPDPITTIVRLGEARTKKNTVNAETYTYGDNGRYYVDLQLIDDDMWWDVSGGYPVYVGPPGEEDKWISHNIFMVEVNNVDPVISPIRATCYLDMIIRCTGEPNEWTRMQLWQGSTLVGEVWLDHQGNEQYATLPAALNMGTINDYYVIVDYFGTDGGGRPTWIFQGDFPSGHTKELKKVMKEDDNHWVITADLLKTMLLGEDIVFYADGHDPGSDDLLFLWQWGDDQPDTVHIYANDGGSMVVGSCGPAAHMFSAHPQRDAWFDYYPNTIRSPHVNPMDVPLEVAVHAFHQAEYHYVHLTLMDDDTKEPVYPTTQLNSGSDSEFFELDLLC